MASLAEQFTIVAVTHNMQQAARVSDVTAFMLADETGIGRSDRGRRHGEALHQAERPANRGLHHRPIRLVVKNAAEGQSGSNVRMGHFLRRYSIRTRQIRGRPDREWSFFRANNG